MKTIKIKNKELLIPDLPYFSTIRLGEKIVPVFGVYPPKNENEEMDYYWYLDHYLFDSEFKGVLFIIVSTAVLWFQLQAEKAIETHPNWTYGDWIRCNRPSFNDEAQDLHDMYEKAIKGWRDLLIVQT